MKSSIDKQQGIVAILDALGAASYSDADVKKFMQSRQNVPSLLDEKIETVLKIERDRVVIFTFNDTILIILKCGDDEPQLSDITDFFSIIRKFLVDSMRHRILFRGSISIGSFYVDEQTNTVMGQAVTDAAAWYDKADWIGVHATPLASIIIERWLENEKKIKSHLMIDYDMPLKDNKKIFVKALNWPKIFFIPSVRPCEHGEEKAKLLEYLSLHQIPRGTESKYSNTLEFFKKAVEEINENDTKTLSPRKKLAK